MSVSTRAALSQSSGRIRLIEAHDRGCEAIIRDSVGSHGQSFHGAWISGLTQTTHLGIPDTEIISPLQRASLIDYSGPDAPPGSRPLCAAYDADSGGPTAEIPALVETLIARGISMVIIEDKEVFAPGLKVNSLASASASQGQADMHEFARTLRAFKTASAGSELMVTARIETFTTRTVEADPSKEAASAKAALHDALTRASVYCTVGGADAIMIHSKSKKPDEVVSFLRLFRARDPRTPLVVVPTTYSTTSEDALYDAGANVIIYANHLMRAKLQASMAVSDVNTNLLFARDNELRACLEAHNYGSLLAKMRETDRLTEVEDLYHRRLEAEAAKCISETTIRLLDTRMAGGADEHIVPVKALLQINARQTLFRLGNGIVLPMPGSVSPSSASEEEVRSSGAPSSVEGGSSAPPSLAGEEQTDLVGGIEQKKLRSKGVPGVCADDVLTSRTDAVELAEVDARA